MLSGCGFRSGRMGSGAAPQALQAGLPSVLEADSINLAAAAMVTGASCRLAQAQISGGTSKAGVTRDDQSQPVELCKQLGDSSQLFTVLRGQYAFHHVRAELRTARELTCLASEPDRQSVRGPARRQHAVDWPRRRDRIVGSPLGAGEGGRRFRRPDRRRAGYRQVAHRTNLAGTIGRGAAHAVALFLLATSSAQRTHGLDKLSGPPAFSLPGPSRKASSISKFSEARLYDFIHEPQGVRFRPFRLDLEQRPPRGLCARKELKFALSSLLESEQAQPSAADSP